MSLKTKRIGVKQSEISISAELLGRFSVIRF